MEEQLNEVEFDHFLRHGKIGGISRQEEADEKTFPDTFLAVADRVFSRQGIARSILIQSVLVNIPSDCVKLMKLSKRAKAMVFSGSWLWIILVGGGPSSGSNSTEPFFEGESEE